MLWWISRRVWKAWWWTAPRFPWSMAMLGRLYYRGLPIEKLVQYPFAAVAHLVVFGDLPDAARLTAVRGLPVERRAAADGACRLPGEAGATAGSSHGNAAGCDALDDVLAARCRNSAVPTMSRKHWLPPPAYPLRSPWCRHCALVVHPRHIPRRAAMANASCNWCMTVSLRKSRSAFSNKPRSCKSITASMPALSRRVW